MRFALSGICDSTLALVRAVTTSPKHELVLVCAAGALHNELADILPEIRPHEDWELLLDGRQAEAVIVAAGDPSETRNDQLRKLVQAGIPLVLVHPACDAMVGFELGMIAEESGSVLFPFVRGQRHHAVTRAVELFGRSEQSPTGPIEQVVVERFLNDRGSRTVLACLSCDAALLLPMIGRVQEVSAFGPQHDTSNYTALSVNMTGAANVPLRWSVVPADGDEGSVVTLVGSKGRAVLSMLGDTATWSLNPNVAADGSRKANDDAALALAEFERVVADDGPPTTSWDDACRTLEIQTAVRESLRRGRKIRLYDDQYSEQQTFKGKMAVGGCSLLMVALVILFGFALYDVVTLPFRDKSASPPDDPAEPSVGLWLRMWPAYPLIAFLVLQLFRLVFWNDRRSGVKDVP